MIAIQKGKTCIVLIATPFFLLVEKVKNANDHDDDIQGSIEI
jgi:hypothetical protein